jgi:hypothetical protein
MVSLRGAMCRGDVYDTGLRVPPLCRALSLLFRRGFQQVSQLLVHMLSLIGRGLRSHSHDHGGRGDVLASSGEDRHLPLALLDLIVYAVCPHLCTLGVEGRWTKASDIVAFVDLLGFMSSDSL